MATNTLLQSLNGSDNQATTGSSNRRQVETFLASAPIAANDLVCLDLTKSANSDIPLYITKANRSAAATVVAVGFALNAATAAGDEVRVTIAGIHESANVTAISAGDRLMASTVAGRAEAYTGSESVPIIAYACDDHTANVAPVIVIKQI